MASSISFLSKLAFFFFSIQFDIFPIFPIAIAIAIAICYCPSKSHALFFISQRKSVKKRSKSTKTSPQHGSINKPSSVFCYHGRLCRRSLCPPRQPPRPRHAEPPSPSWFGQRSRWRNPQRSGGGGWNCKGPLLPNQCVAEFYCRGARVRQRNAHGRDPDAHRGQWW